MKHLQKRRKIVDTENYLGCFLWPSPSMLPTQILHLLSSMEPYCCPQTLTSVLSLTSLTTSLCELPFFLSGCQNSAGHSCSRRSASVQLLCSSGQASGSPRCCEHLCQNLHGGPSPSTSSSVTSKSLLSCYPPSPGTAPERLTLLALHLMSWKLTG